MRKGNEFKRGRRQSESGETSHGSDSDQGSLSEQRPFQDGNEVSSRDEDVPTEESGELQIFEIQHSTKLQI